MSRLLWIVVIIFVIIGTMMIINAYQVNLRERQGQKTFAVAVGKWTLQVGKNMKNILGLAVKQDWLPEVPENETKNLSVYVTE